MHPVHALWGVWEDHHRRWSHWVFPEILSWRHPSNRRVSDILTPPHFSPLSSPLSPCLSLSLHPTCRAVLRNTLICHHPIVSSHIQRCETGDLQVYDSLLRAFHLQWTLCRRWQRCELYTALVLSLCWALGYIRHETYVICLFTFGSFGCDRWFLHGSYKLVCSSFTRIRVSQGDSQAGLFPIAGTGHGVRQVLPVSHWWQMCPSGRCRSCCGAFLWAGDERCK